MLHGGHTIRKAAPELTSLSVLIVLVWYKVQVGWEQGSDAGRVGHRTNSLFFYLCQQPIARYQQKIQWKNRHLWEDTYSWSRKREYSSSPTFTGLPPYWKSISNLSRDCCGQKTYLRNQNLVPNPNTHRYSLAFLVQTSWAHRQNLCFIQILDTALRQEYTTGSFRFSFYSLHQDTIEEWQERFDALQGGRLM